MIGDTSSGTTTAPSPVDSSTSSSAPGTGLFRRTLRRHWRMLLGCAVAAGLLGAGYVASWRTYPALATVSAS